MKRFTFITFLSLTIISLFAQTTVFQENFETIPLGMTADIVSGHTWSLNTRLHSQGTKCDSASVTTADTIYLTTNTFSTLNKYNVFLTFDHICKLEYFDGGIIEVSNNNGLTWTKLTGGYYLSGNAFFGTIGNKFNATSYGVDWSFTNNNAVPQNTWWKTEVFDISTLASNSSSIKIRFGICDMNSNGSFGNAGWFLDSIFVTASFSELIPPNLSLIAPILRDTAYSSGPYSVGASISDISGIDTAMCIYTVSPENITDTIAMVYDNTTVDSFYCNIPFNGYGRTITYYVKVSDASASHNVSTTTSHSFFCKYTQGGDVIIGTGTSTDRHLPMEMYYGYTYSQSIFKSTYFNGIFGSINKIAYYYNGNGGYTDAIKIYMGTTNSTSFASTSSWIPLSNLTLVYNGNITTNTTAGWIEIILQTPFSYNGNNNLIIAFDENTSGFHASGDEFFCTQLDNDVSSIYYYNDGTNPNPASPPTSGSFLGTSSYNPNVKMTFTTSTNITNDIGVNQFINPTGASGLVAGASLPINITIKNYGIDTVTSASIAWKYDGILQTPISYSDSLKADSISPLINLDTINPTYGAHHILAWTENPNGVSDYNIANDSTSVSFFACTSSMSGIYTIGGTNADFATFNDAVLGLSMCGINGGVTFNVASGTYNEHINLASINGLSATNTITFQSANGNSSTVTLSYNANSSSDNYVVKLDGSPYVTFKNMSFKATDSQYARVFVFENGIHDINIQNNIIEATNQSTANNSNMALIWTKDSVGNNLQINNNSLINGSYGISLQGTNSASYWFIDNNIIHGNYARGIYIKDVNLILINNNDIKADTLSQISNYYGIFVDNLSGLCSFIKNKILTTNTSSAFGIRLSNCAFASNSPVFISNNMIQLHGNTASNFTTGGIYSYKSKNINIYYNSIRVSGIQVKSAAVSLTGTNSTATANINIVNNIFTNQAGGFIYYVNNVDTSKFTCHHNNLWDYGNSSNFAYKNGYIATMAAWNNISGETNSVSIIPYFATANNLHIANNTLNGLGTPITSITTDIDGDIRNTTTPDMGADEFNPSPYDVAAVELLGPIGGCGLNNEIVVFKIKNVGSAAINGNFTLRYKIKQSAGITSEVVFDTIPPGDSLTYTFATILNLNVTTYGKDSLFELVAWVDLTGDNIPHNDSAYLDIESKYQPPAPVTTDITVVYGASPNITAVSNDSLTWFQYDTSTVKLATTNHYHTGPLSDTTTFWVSASSGTPILKLTETVQYKDATGHTNPYPSYLPTSDFDGVEISNMGTGVADISGYSINVQSGSIIYNYTFPSGTQIISGNVLLIIYGYGTIGSLGNNVFRISNSTSISSSSPVTYWLKDASGTIIDAFASNGASFSSASGVSSSDFSGSLTGGGGHPGAIRTISDNNTASDWTVINPATASFGTYNSQLPLASGGSSNCSSIKVPLTVNVTGYPSVDAGISTFVNPQGNLIAGSQQIIKAELSNYGTTSLISVDVAWHIDGTLQDTIYHNTSLASLSKDTIILDTIQFTGGSHTIRAWTINPNNTADLYNFNDTSNINFMACLGGTYTIGSGTQYDFPTFAAALLALQTAGVCSNIIFNVAAGTYNEKLVIQNISSTGPNATVTFQAANGDSTSVILNNNSSIYSTNYTLKLDGAKYFRFKNMTIKTSVTNYQQGVIEIAGGSENNIFENCVIESGTSLSASAKCIYSNNGNDKNNTFINNYLKNGYYSFYFQGAGTNSLEEGTVFTDNIIEGFSNTGIYVKYQDGIIIKRNHISNGAYTSLRHGIYCHYCDNNLQLIGNNLDLTPIDNMYGIRLHYCDGDANNRGLVANNMISITTGSTTQYGAYLSYSTKFDFVYNSINITSGSSNSQALYFHSASTADVNIANNIIRDSVGYTIYTNNTLGITSSDYNAFHSNATNFAYWNGNRANITALQTASSKNTHSVVVNPDFFSNHNLHLPSTQLSGLATPVSSINKDIDGELRSQTGPTIGADEVNIIPFDIGIPNLYNVPNISSEFQSITPSITVKNYGTDTVNTFIISYSVNGGTAITQNYNNSLAPGDTVFITLASFASPAGNSQLCIKTILVADSNTFNDFKCKSFFGTPAKDALVHSIVELTGGCSLTSDTIMLWIKNNGANNINSATSSTITMNYQIGNSAPVSQNFTPILLSGDSMLFIFSQQANISNSTANDITYNIKVWVNWTGDNVNYNDTAYTSVISLHSPATPTVVTPVIIPYASSTNLTASSINSIYWYGDTLLTNLLTIGNSYTTSMLYADSTYYVVARDGLLGGLNNIGTGTISQNFIPAYGYYDYGWSSFIYDANEISNAGRIDSISFYVQNNSNYTLYNQQLYLSHTTMSTHPNTNYPGTAGKTKVWDGNLTVNGSGWVTIALDTHFDYNGTDNLLFYWENHDGSYSNGYPQWRSTNISGKTIYKYRDNSFPNINGIYYNLRPNVKFFAKTTGCASHRATILVDVGAQPTTDVGATAILTPTTQVNLGSAESIKVSVKNFGSATQSNIPVAYQINNGALVWDTITSAIGSGASYDITFSQTANLSMQGQVYNIRAFTSLAGDNTNQNDTINSLVTCLAPAYCTSTATSTAYHDISNFTFAGINNNSTTPYNKLYTDFTSVTPAQLTPNGYFNISITISSSSSYSSSGYLKVFIDYNRNGIYEPATETAYSNAFAAASSSNPVVVSGIIQIPPNAANGLTEIRIVAERNGSATSVTPCGTYTHGETEDYSALIITPIAHDAGVTAISSPTGIISGSSSALNVVVKNYGTQNFDTVNVSYILNGSAPITIQHIASVAPNASTNVSFGNITLQSGSNNLCIYTSLAGDINTFNDQFCSSPFREATINLSYSDDFEGNNIWRPGLNSGQWEKGIPQMTSINTAHSPTNVWAIDLDGNYLNNSSEYLYSPKMVTTNLDSATLKFWHYYNTQSNDGCQLQVLIAGTWSSLGYIGDLNSTAWYNSNMGGPHFWSGNSNGWIQSTYKMDFTAFPFVTTANPNPPNSIRFRFYFQSNNYGSGSDGWAIDDFEIILPSVAIDAKPNAIISPINSIQTGNNTSVTMEVKNNGTSPITSQLPVYYNINGGTNVIENYTPANGTLAPSASETYTFNTPFVAPSNSFTFCVGTNLSGDQYPQNNKICKTINVTAANIDAGIISVKASPSCNDTTSIFTHPTVVVIIKNFGLNTLTTIPVKYTINGGTSFINGTWTGNLNSGDTASFTFTNTYISPVGNYSLCALTSLAADPNPANNQLCHSYLGATCPVDGIEKSNGYMFSVEQNKPNPAYGITHINYVVPYNGKIMFEFKNALGQLVYTKKSNARTGSNKITIDANKFANGVYFYTIHFNKQRITRRFIVNN